MSVQFYNKYILPLISAILVTLIKVWWHNSIYAEPYTIQYSFIFFIITVFVAYLLNLYWKYDMNNKMMGPIFIRQGKIIVVTFVAMYILEFVIFGLWFAVINISSCGLPFCV